MSKRLATLLVTLAVVAAACSGGDDEETQTDVPETTTTTARRATTTSREATTTSTAAGAATTVVASGAPATTVTPATTGAPATTSAPPTTVRARATTTTLPAGVVAGGTLVVALSADPGHLNPAITTSGGVHAASELLYNGLVFMDASQTANPELAESWTVEQGGAVYRFKLRRDVKFHDGKPFTSADVKFTFEELLLKLHGRTAASVAPELAGIDTPDPYTVVFRFKQPYAPFLQQLDVTEAPILPKHVFSGGDPNTNPANLKPVGTGPFQFVSYAKGAEVVYAKNKSYFRAPQPYLDRVVIRIIPSKATRVLALERGEVDWVSESDGFGPDRARLVGSGKIRTTETPYNPGGTNCIMTVSFNLDRPVLKDQRVRQAIAHALNRQQFLEQILFREGRVAAAPIHSGIGWAHATGLNLPGYDQARARQLLDEAGWKDEGGGPRYARGVPGVPDGFRLVVDFVHFPTFAKYGELYRQHLEAVGFEVQLRPTEPAVFSPLIFRDRNFDSNIISYCNATDPEIGVRRMYHSSQISATPFTNAAGYRNAQVDGLFNAAGREIDRARRGQLYRQVQEIVARELPYFWIVEPDGVRGYSSGCAGFKFYNGLFAEGAYCKR